MKSQIPKSKSQEPEAPNTNSDKSRAGLQAPGKLQNSNSKSIETIFLSILLLTLAPFSGLSATLAFETTSPYHHIRVIDHNGFRILCFDDAQESQIALKDPMKGHFEYTEYFHMPWLWNTQIVNVLMIGLGGATAQRSFEYYYPGVTVQTAEIDPTVVQVTRDYFRFAESERQKVQVSDGRVFLRRSASRYDLIVLDAYVQGRYGSCIPQHLATKEFFESVRDHLTTNGIVAYNVIGSLTDANPNILGAIYRTLKTVFPQVYSFPAVTEQNVVLVATKAKMRVDVGPLRQRANLLVQGGQIRLPGFRERLERFQGQPPVSSANSPILTDDYAPVEALSGAGGKVGLAPSLIYSPSADKPAEK